MDAAQTRIMQLEVDLRQAISTAFSVFCAHIK
jgi:hypothetical protein